MIHTNMRQLAAACLTTVLSLCAVLGQNNASTLIRGAVHNDRGEPVPNARV